MNDILVNQMQESVVVSVGPRLDFQNAHIFREHCENHVAEGTCNFVLDLSDTGILDSTGLGALFALNRKIKRLGGKILLLNPTPSASVVIKLTHCDQVFPVCDSLDAAEGHLRKVAPAVSVRDGSAKGSGEVTIDEVYNIVR